jgi:hypothetical protein
MLREEFGRDSESFPILLDSVLYSGTHAGDYLNLDQVRNMQKELKQLLLSKAYQALPEGGALIVFESLIDDERRANTFGLLMSLNMLIETPGGFDYTGQNCSQWMREAGFRETRVEHLIGPDSMIVGIK